MKTYFMIIILITGIALFISCASTPDVQTVIVTARDFKFLVNDSIPSGWINFKFKNEGHTVHFFQLSKLPDSISYDTYIKDVEIPFEWVFDSLKGGVSKAKAGSLLVQMVPAWFFSDVKVMGGAGLTAKEKSSEFTSKLTPGTYVMECYIKEQGVFHSALGMIRPLVVTSKKSNSNPPMTNLEITLSNDKMEITGAPVKGYNTVAVHFKEQPSIGLGNDVQLVKLTDTTKIDSVVQWLDWMNITGLQSPAPAEFLGGTQEMPAGNVSYFTVTLEPGRYAWLSEGGVAKGIYKEFTVK